MRISVAKQLPLVPQMSGHQHINELSEMSSILDTLPKASNLVLGDLLAGGINPKKGATGLSGEQVLRIAIIKQANGYSYEQLAFHLADSLSYRAFCRLGFSDTPSSSTLQHNVKKICPETLEKVNQMLIKYAEKVGVEDGRKIRTDCTVIDSNIHEPTDSSLLFDCVRVLARKLVDVQKLVTVPFVNHTRRAKRRSIGIMNAKKKKQRVQHYRDLIKATAKTVGYAEQAVVALESQYVRSVMETTQGHIYNEMKRVILLSKKVLDQTRRRVIDGESVPVADKIVSIFEPHTDIIIKDRREILYGHKVCLTTGASGLVLDCVIESGNPADSTLAVRMVKNQIELYGHPPRKVCFDGGFSSKKNLEEIKELKVEDVVFSKSPGIGILDMVKNSWAYRQLKRFRAGIESNISFLKRSFGWSRCTWRSLRSFKAYTFTSVVAANLLTLSRHALQ